MTAPRTCPECGAALDAGEVCDCRKVIEAETAAESHAEPVADGYMEFKMGDSLEHLPATIDFNFQQLKDQLAASLETYSGLVVTEDGIKSAREDRARLNKLREALEGKRKEVKKQCMAPYTDFEAKVKELVGLVDKPIAAIDGQLNAYEERRRAEKRSAVEAIYNETVGELRGLLPFEKLWQPSWYTVGVSVKKIREAIIAAEKKAASDLEVLSTVESEFAEAVKLKYLEALDLNAALSERARLQEQARPLREYEERQNQAKAAATADQAEKVSIPPAQEEDIRQVGETVYRLVFECHVTMSQAKELSAWLNAHNISFRRI